MADYEKKYPFCAKETRGLTMRDAEWAFQLSPDPPKVEKLNDYIVMAAVIETVFCSFSTPMRNGSTVASAAFFLEKGINVFMICVTTRRSGKLTRMRWKTMSAPITF